MRPARERAICHAFCPLPVYACPLVASFVLSCGHAVVLWACRSLVGMPDLRACVLRAWGPVWFMLGGYYHPSVALAYSYSLSTLPSLPHLSLSSLPRYGLHTGLQGSRSLSMRPEQLSCVPSTGNAPMCSCAHVLLLPCGCSSHPMLSRHAHCTSPVYLPFRFPYTCRYPYRSFACCAATGRLSTLVFNAAEGFCLLAAVSSSRAD